MAAERETVDVNEPSSLECGNRGGAGAHINHGRAQISLVIGENREPCDIGRGRHGLDVEMTTLDGEHQIAGGGNFGGRHMHVDPEAAAKHSTRIANAVYAID